MTDLFAKLREPLPAIHWRAQSVAGNGNSAMALAYMDARDVMERLDDVCGPDGWQDSYTETARGRIIGTIKIKYGDEWIAKSDGAGDTAVEGEKGAMSDAFKRAAVKWGIGRYLYDMPTPWAECETYEKNGRKFFRKWTAKGLADLAKVAGQARSIGEEITPPEPPHSVIAMIEGLKAATKAGTAADYWKEHWPAIDAEWRPHVLAEKEKLKEKEPA